MPYTQNPHLPKLRAKAVMLVRYGWSQRAVARHVGVEPSTVSRWCRALPGDGSTLAILPTKSSRPHHHPRAVNHQVVERIRQIRLQRGRCAQVVHAQLLREHITVSLSTVQRVLDRLGLTHHWPTTKQRHVSIARPIVSTPGTLVEIDTVHLMTSPKTRIYLCTLVDVCSRWAHVLPSRRLNTLVTVRAVDQARRCAPFTFSCIQSDHGSEFAPRFTQRLSARGILHRHIRVRQPNDNAHVERFNRTIQEELKTDLQRYKTHLPKLQQALQAYLMYYNTERLHMGLNYQTPSEVLRSY